MKEEKPSLHKFSRQQSCMGGDLLMLEIAGKPEWLDVATQRELECSVEQKQK